MQDLRFILQGLRIESAMIRTNFHTHSTFCDGKDTPEQMIQTAIDKGFLALGFSGHSYFFLDEDVSMNEQTQRSYREEILRLKKKYKNEIEIYLGIEQDSFSAPLAFSYDYVIASVHSVEKNGVFCQVDYSLERMTKNLAEQWGGDFELYAEDYFSEVCCLLEKIPEADVIGHIDLVSKYSEKLGISQSARFLRAAARAVERLAPYGKPFEINTGAIARGMRSTPYPSPEILSMIRAAGGEIMINSDCHNREHLDCAFDAAVTLAKDCGFSHHKILTKEGWKSVPL